MIRSVFEGKQPRPPAKVAKYMLSGKGCGVAQTTRDVGLESSHHLKSA